MPKFKYILNAFIKEREKNQLELEKAKTELNILIKKEKDPEFKLTAEYIDAKTELKLKIRAKEEKEKDEYAQKFNFLLNKIKEKFSENDERKILDVIAKNFDGDFEKLEREIHDRLPAYQNAIINDVPFNEWIKVLTIPYLNPKENFMVEALANILSKDDLEEVTQAFIEFVPTSVEPKPVHTFNDLITKSLEHIETLELTEDRKESLSNSLNRLNEIEVTAESKKDYIEIESENDRIKSSRLRDYALLEANDKGISEALKYTPSYDLIFTDEFYNNKDKYLEKIKSIKYEVSIEVKDKIKLMYNKMKELGLINDDIKGEQGVKLYAFTNFVNIRSKVKTQLEEKDYTNFEENVVKYEQELTNLKQLYKFINENFNLSRVTVPGNMSNFRNEFVPYELKKDALANGALNGFSVLFSALKKYNITIDEYLENPIENYFKIVDQDLGLNVDELYNDEEDIDVKFTRLYFRTTFDGTAYYRYLENLIVYETDVKSLKNNSLAYELNASGITNTYRVQNYKIPQKYLDDSKPLESYKTVLNYILLKDELKQGKYNFSDIYGYTAYSKDGLDKIEPKINTKEYINNHKIDVNKFYNDVINQLSVAYKSRKLKNSHKNPLVESQTLPFLYKTLTNVVESFIELNQNLKYSELSKLNEFLTKPYNALKDIIDDKKYIDNIDAVKETEWKLKPEFILSRINDTLTNNGLKTIDKNNVIFKMYKAEIDAIEEGKKVTLSNDETITLIKELINANKENEEQNPEKYVSIIKDINKKISNAFDVKFVLENDKLFKENNEKSLYVSTLKSIERKFTKAHGIKENIEEDIEEDIEENIEDDIEDENVIGIEIINAQYNKVIEEQAKNLGINPKAIKEMLDASFDKLGKTINGDDYWDALKKGVEDLTHENICKLIDLTAEKNSDFDLEKIYQANDELNKIAKQKYFGCFNWYDKNFYKEYKEYADEVSDFTNYVDLAFENYTFKQIKEPKFESYAAKAKAKKIVKDFNEKYDTNISLRLPEGHDEENVKDEKWNYLDAYRSVFESIRKDSYKDGIFSVGKAKYSILSVETFKEIDKDINKLLKAFYQNYGKEVEPEYKTSPSPLESLNKHQRIKFLESLFHLHRIIDVKDTNCVSYNNINKKDLYSLSHNEKKVMFNNAYNTILNAIDQVKNNHLDYEGIKAFLYSYKTVYKTMAKIHNENWFIRMLRHPFDFAKENITLSKIEVTLADAFDIKQVKVHRYMSNKDDNIYGNKRSEKLNTFKNNEVNKYKTYNFEQALEITNLITDIDKIYNNENVVNKDENVFKQEKNVVKQNELNNLDNGLQHYMDNQIDENNFNSLNNNELNIVNNNIKAKNNEEIINTDINTDINTNSKKIIDYEDEDDSIYDIDNDNVLNKGFYVDEVNNDLDENLDNLNIDDILNGNDDNLNIDEIQNDNKVVGRKSLEINLSEYDEKNKDVNNVRTKDNKSTENIKNK